ncbi:MAG: cation:proton antiporter [Gemmatimonadaceae bacterium]
MPELSFLRDILVLFGLSVAVVVAFHRFGVPPIVGFLITGVLCGPYGFGLIQGVHEVEQLAELGVVLLLFTVGIEFSVQHLIRLRTLLLVGGSLQVGLTLVATLLIAHAFGVPWRIATFLGMLVTLSSTAIVLRLFIERGEVDAPAGRVVLSILIFQDLCIVPMVLVTPFLGGAGDDLAVIGMVAAKALGFVLMAVIAARFLIPWLLSQVVHTRKREVFLLTILLICLGMAWASSAVGLSLALGAFIAGLILSESEYNHQALGEILPLREVFNSLFFVAIGMLFDVRTVLSDPLLVAGALVAAILLKALITTGVAWTLGMSLRVALVAGLAIAQIGEFAFVLSAAGLGAGLLDARLYQLFLAVAVGSMALTPLLIAAAPRIADAVERLVPSGLAAGRSLPGTEPDEKLAHFEDHVIIVGFGMNGKNLARVLTHLGVPFVAIEMNPETVRNERAAGIPILYGDSSRREILAHAGIGEARVVVVAISDPGATRSTVDAVRRINPSTHIIVRTRYVKEMQALIALGTNEVVPEEFETSVEIFSRVLQRYLIPRDVIERCISDVRRDSYQMFRTMAGTHSSATGLDSFLGDLSLSVYRTEGGSPLIGRSLEESQIRVTSGATVAAMQKVSGETVVNPLGTDVIFEGDVLLLLGSYEQLQLAEPMFRSPRPQGSRRSSYRHGAPARPNVES